MRFVGGCDRGCNCTACLLRRALERLTAQNRKLRAERDEFEARLIGTNEGVVALKEEIARLQRGNSN